MDAPNVNDLGIGSGAGGVTLSPSHANVRLVERKLRDDAWPLTPQERAECIQFGLGIIRSSDPQVTPFLKVSAFRTLILADGRNVQRERNGIEARQGDALIALTAVRTQLAAQLAADPGALASLSGGAVIPSLPAPVPADPVPGIPNTEPAYSCAMCQDAGVLVTSKGAYPCPNCSSDAGPADAADLAY